MSLRLRLLLALAPLFVIGLLVANVATYTSLQSFLVSRVDQQLLATHPGVESALENAGNSNGQFGGGRGAPGGPGGGFDFTAIAPGTFGEILDSSGAAVGTPTNFLSQGDTSTSGGPVLPSTLSLGAGAQPRSFTVSGTGEYDQYRVYLDRADPNHFPAGDVLVVAAPLDDVNSTLHQLLLLELAISGGVTLVIVLASWWIVRRGLRPLVRMGDTARSIVATDLSRRVEPAAEKTEVGRLGLALNAMLAQLESAFAERERNEQRLRHFISDASHELRTPLTSMQGYAELLRRNPDMNSADVELAMRRMEEETRRMGVLVDDLLLLARLDQGRPLDRQTVDLEALVADAASDVRVVDPERPITTRASAPLLVSGDEMRLRQVLGNLLRNAIVHTPVGTPVEVSLRGGRSFAMIDVIDHGPGIPADQRRRIFERFHRADPGRSRDQRGSGLGLSIASAVVTAHGGRIDVSETPGGGATFTIELPLLGAEIIPGPPGRSTNRTAG
jgi:two-component system OmpR family sensor kinase